MYFVLVPSGQQTYNSQREAKGFSFEKALIAVMYMKNSPKKTNS